MSKVRCISSDILENDNFNTLPNTAKLLYIYFNQETDNLGFVDNLNIVLSKSKAKRKDLELLIQREYIIQIKDWLYLEVHFRLNNKNLRPERGAKSRFTKYLDGFEVDEARGMYVVKLPTNCRQNDDKTTANCRENSEQNKVKENKLKESKSISFNDCETVGEFKRRLSPNAGQ